MAQIVVTPEELERAAGTFEAKKEETQEILSSLRVTMESLDAEWEGVAQAKFYDEWNQMFPKMTEFTTLLGQISTELQRIAQVFRETDEQVI